MLASPDLLIIPLLCAARNMDPDTSGAEVPAANVARYRGHLYFLVLRKSQSWESQLIQHTVRCRLISIASEIKYHLKLARSHQSGRELIWNVQQFLCWSEDLGFDSERESSQPRLRFHELMILNRYLYWIIHIVTLSTHKIHCLSVRNSLIIYRISSRTQETLVYLFCQGTTPRQTPDWVVCYFWQLWSPTVLRWVWGLQWPGLQRPALCRPLQQMSHSLQPPTISHHL